MVLVLLDSVNEAREEQPLKALSPMAVMVCDSVSEIKEVQQ